MKYDGLIKSSSAEVLQALRAYGKTHFNCRPGFRNSGLGQAVYNQLRARTGTKKDWQHREKIQALSDSMTTAHHATVSRLKKSVAKHRDMQGFYPLRLTSVDAAKKKDQVKVKGVQGLAIELGTCNTQIKLPKKFLHNARQVEAPWLDEIGVQAAENVQLWRNHILDLSQSPATTISTSRGITVELASTAVVDFIYLALCDTARYLDTVLGQNKWCITWGTCLATMRSPSGGFIPWDCDADVLAVPENYDKFMEEELPLLTHHFASLGHVK